MNQQIVNLRGVAILMVMLGHSIIIYDHTFDLLKSDVQMPFFETLKHMISFVQMKLFISISGFLLAYKCLASTRQQAKQLKEWTTLVLDKAYRLLIPYLCVLLLYNNPLKYLLGIPGYKNPKTFILEQLSGTNCAHLWFLPCLFLLMLIGYPLFCWAGKALCKHLLLLTLFLGVNYFSNRLPEYYQLREAGYYLLFFHLGYLVNWSRQIYAERLSVIKSWKIIIPLLTIIISIGYIINLATSIGYEIYLSVVIIVLFYALMPSFNSMFINEISKKSYGLYLFHSPLVYITAVFCPNMDPWLMVFVNFICFGSLAYLLTVFFSQSKLKFIIGA